MIHQYKNNGYNIVMDVNSGAIHVVDDFVYDLIKVADDKLQDISNNENNNEEMSKKATSDARDSIKNTAWSKIDKSSLISEFKDIYAEDYKNLPDDELQEALDEIEELINNEELFTEDIYKEPIANYKARPTVVKALCLHVAHDCNLACRYCFAGKGEYQGEKEIMSLEVGKKALDFLVENSGNRRNLEVDFFGGEPLLNFEVVKELVSYGRSIEKTKDKHFRFTLTTNGVLLNDEIMKFANENMDNVVLSIDGRKSIHDLMRPFPSGDGSYDLIVPKFIKFADSRGQDKYYVRGTFTHNNLDFSKDVLHLADLGFKQISVEPVVAKDTDDYAIREEDLPKLYEEYDNLAKEMVKRHGTEEEFNFFHYMIDLEGGPCVYKRLSGCGSGTEYLAVTPTGELYPCHQFVGNTDFIMGNVDTGITNTNIRDEFKECNVYAKDSCKDCFAKFYCSGGCAANAFNFTGDIKGAYEVGCKLQRKRVENAIMIKAACTDT